MRPHLVFLLSFDLSVRLPHEPQFTDGSFYPFCQIFNLGVIEQIDQEQVGSWHGPPKNYTDQHICFLKTLRALTRALNYQMTLAAHTIS